MRIFVSVKLGKMCMQEEDKEQHFCHSQQHILQEEHIFCSLGQPTSHFYRLTIFECQNPHMTESLRMLLDLHGTECFQNSTKLKEVELVPSSLEVLLKFSKE
mmetsp:Transcript_5558/g.8936  ORF Transcript_5558/g.8936 Transcript_5558/m.8936 type:complete len:102 (-) Transcript_5558:1122-1427(-)